MAGKIQNLGGADDEMQSISEINVTPFVDVVLVLLVIFMVTAPMLVREQMAVNLPKAQSGEKSASEALTIIISREGVISFKDHTVSVEQLDDEIKAVAAKDPTTQAIISADENSKHGDVVKVMDSLKKAGLTKFAIQIKAAGK